MNSIVILSTGQSNMPHTVLYDWQPQDNLFVWDFDANKSPSNSIGAGFVKAPSTKMGPSIVGADVLAKRFPQHNFYVLNFSVGGLGLDNWGANPPNYNFRQAIKANVEKALSTIGKDRIDYLIWAGAESDVNQRNQTIPSLLENNLIAWLKTNDWFDSTTPTYVLGFSPFVQTSANNNDFMWRRYNGSLKSFVRNNVITRSFVDTDDFSINLFDPTGSLPYIHKTPLGYYKAGERLGLSILNGKSNHDLDKSNTSGSYTPTPQNLVNCSVVFGQGSWTRVEDTISVKTRGALTSIIGNVQTSFTLDVPIYCLNNPNRVTGTYNSVNNGESGIVVASNIKQQVQVFFTPVSSGISSFSLEFNYDCNHCDGIPNPPINLSWG